MNKRSGQESRKIIMKAAAKVFAARGYRRTTIREVARTAGISVGGIYLYFPNKEKLFSELVSVQMGDFSRQLDRLHQEEPVTALRSYIKIHIDHVSQKKKMISRYLKEQDVKFLEPMRKAFLDTQKKLVAYILARGIKKDLFKVDDRNKTANLIVFALSGLFTSYFASKFGDMQVLADDLCSSLLFYITKPEGRIDYDPLWKAKNDR